MNQSGTSSVVEQAAIQPKDGGSIPTVPLQFQFRTDARFAGRDLVLAYHYSQTFHPVFVLMGTEHLPDGECVAACCFRTPSARWKYPVLELARLVRKEGVEFPLTQLISRTVAAVRRAGVYDLLISYADKTHQHHGGIYQAASWFYSGATKKQNDGVIVDGTFVAGRACNNMFGTRSVTKLQALFPARSFIAHWDEGKHLYWRALTKKAHAAATELGLRQLPYPKPALAA